MQARKLTWLIIFFALSAALAKADDTAATLGAGGLVPVKSTQIVMESEDLQISIRKITVRYVFRNNGDKDIETIVAFPLPDLAGGIDYGGPIRIPNEKSMNFVDFRVTADGKPVAAKMEARAFLKDRDVTARLRAEGLPVSVLSRDVDAAAKKIPAARLKQLEKEGLLWSDGPGQWVSAWMETVKFYWTQRFPARGTVEIVHTYRPISGGAYITVDSDGAEIAKDYCGGPDDLRRIAQVKESMHPKDSGDIVMNENQVNFILTTANNWAGPIGKFHLTVESDSPQDIVLTCMEGLKRVGPTRYEMTRTDFHPTSELLLDILQPDK